MEPWLIAVIAASAAVVVIVAAVIIILRVIKHNKIKKSNEEADQIVNEKAKEVSDSFGGKENIVSIQSSGSRVTVLVENPDIVNRDEINNSLENVMFMGKKIVFVIGSKSETFKELLEENIGKSNLNS